METDFLPISPIIRPEEELRQMSPPVLAFVGDAVQTLYVRTRLSQETKSKPNVLHKLVAKQVKAGSQAVAVISILSELSEEETDVYKRVRNCKTHTQPKHASLTEYKLATGFEGLIGYLYLSGRHERLNYLLNLAYAHRENQQETVSVSENDIKDVENDDIGENNNDN